MNKSSVEWGKQLATVPALQRELDEVNDAFQAEMVEWEIATRKHDEKVKPLAYRASALEQEIAIAHSCEAKLRDTYTGPLLAELEQIEEDRRRIHAQIEPIEQTRHAPCDMARPASDFVQGHKYHNPSEIEAAGHQKTVAECEKGIAELRSQLLPLAAREQEIQGEMSKP